MDVCIYKTKETADHPSTYFTTFSFSAFSDMETFFRKMNDQFFPVCNEESVDEIKTNMAVLRNRCERAHVQMGAYEGTLYDSEAPTLTKLLLDIDGPISRKVCSGE